LSINPLVTTHDYTRRGIGHDYTFTPKRGGLEGYMQGWSYQMIREGDYLLLQNGDTSTRYRVKRIRYYMDPKDMWEAEVVFAPRTVEEAP
jgi:hypothetical protein